MKKIQALLLVLVLVFMVGCGEEEEIPASSTEGQVESLESAAVPDAESSESETAVDEQETENSEKESGEETGTEETETGRIARHYLENFNSENMLLRFIMHINIDGAEESAEMTTANKGDKTVNLVEYEGEKVRFIMDGSSIYMVSDNQKIAVNMAALGIDSSFYEVPEFIGTEITGSGTDTVRGKTLPYEEIALPNEGAVRYYFDGEELAFIASVGFGSGFVMEILEISSSVPESLFEIPTNYTVTG